MSMWSALDRCNRSDQNMVSWRSWCNLCFWHGLHVVFGIVVGLVAIIDFQAELGGDCLGVVVVDHRVTLLWKCEISVWIVRTWSSLIFTSGVSPRWCRELSASISQMSVNSYLSGRWQSMLVTNCHQLNLLDSMSDTQCQRLNVRQLIFESDLLPWSHIIALPCTWLYCLIILYEW